MSYPTIGAGLGWSDHWGVPDRMSQCVVNHLCESIDLPLFSSFGQCPLMLSGASSRHNNTKERGNPRKTELVRLWEEESYLQASFSLSRDSGRRQGEGRRKLMYVSFWVICLIRLVCAIFGLTWPDIVIHTVTMSMSPVGLHVPRQYPSKYKISTSSLRCQASHDKPFTVASDVSLSCLLWSSRRP